MIRTRVIESFSLIIRCLIRLVKIDSLECTKRFLAECRKTLKLADSVVLKVHIHEESVDPRSPLEKDDPLFHLLGEQHALGGEVHQRQSQRVSGLTSEDWSLVHGDETGIAEILFRNGDVLGLAPLEVLQEQVLEVV